MMKKELSEFIINMRTAANFSRQDLAHQLCLSISTMEAYERGQKMPANPARFEKYLRKIVKQAIRANRKIQDVRYNLVG